MMVVSTAIPIPLLPFLPYLCRVKAWNDFIWFASGGTEAEGVRLDLGSRGRGAALLALTLACTRTHREEEIYFGGNSELCVCIVCVCALYIYFFFSPAPPMRCDGCPNKISCQEVKEV